jgi:hypothetical protein
MIDEAPLDGNRSATDATAPDDIELGRIERRAAAVEIQAVRVRAEQRDEMRRAREVTEPE